MSSRPASGTPPAAGPVVPETFGEEREIRFRCRKGIGCWNACCSNIDIPLTPYDVLRLKRRLELSSGDFLREFTFPYEMEKDGMAGVKLKPVDGGSACRFMRPEGCAVYDDRPTACRYYPVALLAMRKQGESTDRSSYALVKEPHCLGHAEDRPITIKDYRREQGLEAYDDAGRGWRQLVLKKKSSGPTLGRPSHTSLQLFFMACYDLDRFRSFVQSDAFGRLYDLGEGDMNALSTSDEALLAFAYRFLRQALFGEDTIPVHSGEAHARRERFRLRAEQLEREAQERRMAAQDEAYAEPDAEATP